MNEEDTQMVEIPSEHTINLNMNLDRFNAKLATALASIEALALRAAELGIELTAGEEEMEGQHSAAQAPHSAN